MTHTLDSRNVQNDVNNLKDFEISAEMLSKAHDEQSGQASIGPDVVPAILLKECKTSLMYPLLLLMNVPLKSGVVPVAFKIGIVKPLHKAGKLRSDQAGYRPIALTAIISKIMELCLRWYILDHIEVNKILIESQHCFRMNRSCLSQLLAHHELLISHLENRHNMDTIYLDITKAFDSLDHGILMARLHTVGITGRTGIWIHNWISGREQSVLANNKLSSIRKVISGVPQGSVLGPLLFLLIINDLGKLPLSSAVSIFADDTRVSRGISSEADAIQLQQDLDTIYKWQMQINLKFNADKFVLLQNGHCSDIKDRYNYLTPNCNNIISREESTKDLGLHMSENGKFSTNIASLIKEVRSITAWIFRVFQSRNPKFVMFLWRTYCQSKIDYFSQLWAPIESP